MVMLDICEAVMFPLIARSTVEPLFVVACIVDGVGVGEGVGEVVGGGVAVEVEVDV